MSNPSPYQAYESFRLMRNEASGLLELVMGEPGRRPVADVRMHDELARIWHDIDRDPATRAVLVRSAGKGFSGGGALDIVEDCTLSQAARLRLWQEARGLVLGMIECSKPIVSAIHGPAVGAGLAIALLADISVAARDARLIDGHTRLGVAAGDHAAIVWPLLCGMAKAKYYLLLCETLSGEQAERIGLVSVAVDAEVLQDEARRIALQLAAGSATAMRWTKHTLNHWLRAAAPIFDASLALEVLGFAGADAREGLSAIRDKRPPRFPAPER